MGKKLIACAALLAAFAFSAFAQSSADLAPVADTVTAMMREKTGIKAKVAVDKVVRRGNLTDVYFTQGFSDFGWTDSDIASLRSIITSEMKENYPSFKLGELFVRSVNVKDLAAPALHNSGAPSAYKYRYTDPRAKAEPFIEQVGAPVYGKGMSGRYIAMWQSHGRYYETDTHRWEWQRAPTERTVEDMYTQSYVIPFLIPMLENAGAYVLTPRERDVQRNEVVADNDPAFAGPRTGDVRRAGTYVESGAWSDAGEGFADSKAVYAGVDNPFRMGTARKAEVVKTAVPTASIKWDLSVPESGSYALYISYKTFDNSSTHAHYTVHHRGGATEYNVNQKRGGSTWIYVGTFEFEKGGDAYVTLDNSTPAGKKFERKSVVSADAVKIGGGMGKIARGEDDEPLEQHVTSGMPAFTEGAMYWMQWAGVDTTIIRGWDDDYTVDYASRGAWVAMMSQEKNIPFDLSLAFHTDAGTTMDDGIIGSLSIYTLLADGSRKLPDGKDRMVGRHLAGVVQDQICNDVWADFAPEWNKRMLWDRSYSESRTPAVPAMLLEFLSHQNFADMKYGLDPGFRFTVSRAIYKGFLKFLSDMYGAPYVVQPLPVNTFSVEFGREGFARLSWNATEDDKEPTATPTGYIVYTRVDDGPFDAGKTVTTTSVEMPVTPGHIYSYKVVAFNDGGKSFPSEILATGIPSVAKARKVMIVNNFDRISAPTWFDTPTYAGFDDRTDSGVPYINEINYVGEVYNFRRDLPWLDDDNPGFSSTFTDYAGKLMAGNTFDYPYIHGKALMDLGYAFCSKSHAAFEQTGAGEAVVDIICGKQVTTKFGSGSTPDKFQVFPVALQTAIRDFTGKGGSVIISGADIATDVWDMVYPIQKDSAYVADTKDFVQKVLGYKWLTGFGSYTSQVAPIVNKLKNFEGVDAPMEYWSKINEEFYCCENPDGILPADGNGAIVLRYTRNEVPAAVFYAPGTYKVCSFGFPLETLKDSKDITAVLRNSLEFIEE